MTDIYDFTMKKMDGSTETMSSYRGKVVLIVNTASKCGFTPQLEQLEALFQKYRDRGFAVLGFPCNQFKEQEPENDAAIQAFCSSTYGVTFPLFSKICVKGGNAEPLFTYLTQQKGFCGFDEGHPLTQKLDEILSEEDSRYREDDYVKWNFTKFLVSADGSVTNRFEPTASMEQVERAVCSLLEESGK